jgi:hypothetical protein
MQAAQALVRQDLVTQVEVLPIQRVRVPVAVAVAAHVPSVYREVELLVAMVVPDALATSRALRSFTAEAAVAVVRHLVLANMVVETDHRPIPATMALTTRVAELERQLLEAMCPMVETVW